MNELRSKIVSRFFEIGAEYGTVRKLSKEFGITEAAISNHIKKATGKRPVAHREEYK